MRLFTVSGFLLILLFAPCAVGASDYAIPQKQKDAIIAGIKSNDKAKQLEALKKWEKIYMDFHLKLGAAGPDRVILDEDLKKVLFKLVDDYKLDHDVAMGYYRILSFISEENSARKEEAPAYGLEPGELKSVLKRLKSNDNKQILDAMDEVSHMEGNNRINNWYLARGKFIIDTAILDEYANAAGKGSPDADIRAINYLYLKPETLEQKLPVFLDSPSSAARMRALQYIEQKKLAKNYMKKILEMAEQDKAEAVKDAAIRIAAEGGPADFNKVSRAYSEITGFIETVNKAYETKNIGLLNGIMSDKFGFCLPKYSHMAGGMWLGTGRDYNCGVEAAQGVFLGNNPDFLCLSLNNASGIEVITEGSRYLMKDGEGRIFIKPGWKDNNKNIHDNYPDLLRGNPIMIVGAKFKDPKPLQNTSSAVLNRTQIDMLITRYGDKWYLIGIN